jgi:hypothetical protein
MRFAFIFLLLLTVAGCSSQQAFDTSRVKMSVDGARPTNLPRSVLVNHSEQRLPASRAALQPRFVADGAGFLDAQAAHLRRERLAQF